MSHMPTPRPFPFDLEALAPDSSDASFHRARKSYVKRNRKSTGIRDNRACDKGRRSGGMVGFTRCVTGLSLVRTALPQEPRGAGVGFRRPAAGRQPVGHGWPTHRAMDGLPIREGYAAGPALARPTP